ncbi:MAG: hypothetical protein K2P90_00435 [Holosporales bacterium]|nr:hypothetical protein [Holosporales bacterium]
MRRSFLFLFLIATASQAMSVNSDDNCESSGERKRSHAGDIPQNALPIKKRFYQKISGPETEVFQVAQPRGQEAETEALDLSFYQEISGPETEVFRVAQPRGQEEETEALDLSVRDRSSHQDYQDFLETRWGNGAFTPYVKNHTNPGFSAGAPSYSPLEAGFSNLLSRTASDVSQPSVSGVMTTQSSLSSLNQFQEQRERPPSVTIIYEGPKKSDQSKGISTTGRTISSTQKEYWRLSQDQSGERLPDKGFEWHWMPEEIKALEEYAENNKKNDRIDWSKIYENPLLLARGISALQNKYHKLKKSGESVSQAKGSPPHNAFLAF